MKHSKTSIILTILISIALFVFGLFSFDNIYETLLPKVDNGFYQSTELGGQFKTSLIFALAFGLTPILTWFTWRVTQLTLNRQKVFSTLTIIICMTLSVLLRQQLIKSYFNRLTSYTNSTTENLKVGFPISKVCFEYYMIVGLCIGCIISYFLFRQKKTYE